MRRGVSSRIVRVVLTAALLAGGAGCGEGAGSVEGEERAEVVLASIEFAQSTAVSSSRLRFRMRGTQGVVSEHVRLEWDGRADGVPFSWAGSARGTPTSAPADEGGVRDEVSRAGGDVGDLIVELPVSRGLFEAMRGARRFEGSVALEALDPFGRVVARGIDRRVGIEFVARPEPEARAVAPPGALVYLDEQIDLGGRHFLRPEEGESVAVIVAGTLAPSGGGAPIDLSGRELVVEWTGSRSRAGIRVDPSIVGVRPGSFSGRVRVENRLEGGERFIDASEVEVSFEIGETFLSTLRCAGEDPCPGAARGELVRALGRGLVRGDGAASMTLLFEGEFTPEGGGGLTYRMVGESAHEQPPDRYIDAERVDFALAYEHDRTSGVTRLDGLGAEPGLFAGMITPVIAGPGGEQRGAAWEGELRVLPTKQLVYVKYLPQFYAALEKYGLRSIDRELRAKLLSVAQSMYAGINVEFVTERPEHFLEYATIEMGGEDPLGRKAFGYDNTTNEGGERLKDTGNLYLTDYIGGFNQGAKQEWENPFGGVYIGSFDYFSPTMAAREMADLTRQGAVSPEFDRVFATFMPALGGRALRASEYPGGARDAAVDEAIWVFGHVVGSTLAHELGHSLGLAYFQGDESRPGTEYHNRGDEPGALMDAGGARPFVERANIGGQYETGFNARNRAYLERILPAPPPEEPELGL